MPCLARKTNADQASLPGDHRDMEPPDPIPNSVVKRVLADGSVEFLHVRVGHRQALILKTPIVIHCRGFFMGPTDGHRETMGKSKGGNLRNR